jgi:Tol biopolymer transport system component
LPLVGGQLKRLTFDNASDSPAWTSDGREIIFVSQSGGRGKLFRVSASAGLPELLGVGANGTDLSISRKGNRLAYVEQAYNVDIWRIEIPGFQGKGSRSVKLISSSQGDFNPQYSPDGKRIVFVSDRSEGTLEIWICDSDGRNSRQLTSVPGSITNGSPRWSPDSRFIVFDSYVKSVANVFVVSAEGGSPRRVTDEAGDGFLPSWSKDGHWIYFCSNHSGNYQIWKMRVEGGKAIRVTQNGGFEPIESVEGKTLAGIQAGAQHTRTKDRSSHWSVLTSPVKSVSRKLRTDAPSSECQFLMKISHENP